MSKTKSQFHQQALTSGLTEAGAVSEFHRLYNHYKNLATNTYRWEGLPEGMESRFIEKFLFEHGQAGFAEHDILNYVVLPCNTSGRLNIYGEPLEYTLTGTGEIMRKSADEMVRILNNDSATPTSLHLRHYCERMAEVDSVIRQNLRQQRFPYIVATDKANEFTMKNMMKKVMEGEEAIYVDKTLTDGAGAGRVGVEAIQTMTPYLIKQLQEHLRDLEEELLKFLGINTSRAKQSGIAEAEIHVNNGEIALNLDLGFKNRQLAAERISAQFGLNVQVVKVIEEIAPIFETTDDSMKEGGNRG